VCVCVKLPLKSLLLVYCTAAGVMRIRPSSVYNVHYNNINVRDIIIFLVFQFLMYIILYVTP